MKISGSMEKTEGSVNVDIFIPFVKILIKKYGNFKVTQDLYNEIIYALSDICEKIEKGVENEVGQDNNK